MSAKFGGPLLLAGALLWLAALAIKFVYYETLPVIIVLALTGTVLAAAGGFLLRAELASLVRRRRVEIALYTSGVVGIIALLAWLSANTPLRYDLTAAGLYSLSDKSVAVLQRLEKPIHIVFFHSHLMGETINRYRQIAAETDLVTVEFHDPALNPAMARMHSVRFPGTSVMTSEGRRVDVNGELEADIINGILRVSQGATQEVCFLTGHGEADPYSKEAHDHVESQADHTHGTGVQYVLHETHGLAKAANSLEELNYTIRPVSILKDGGAALEGCAVLVVPGPRSPILDSEVTVLRHFLAQGGDALFMIDPFTETGLEPVFGDYGVVLESTLVIDPSHHFAADRSSPAVTQYNNHQVTRDLPLTFFPGVRSLKPGRRVAGAAVTPVINSSLNSFGETSNERVAFDEGEDSRGPLTLMVAANKRPVSEEDVRMVQSLVRDPSPGADAEPPMRAEERSRVIIVGDSDFATNSFFHILGNGNLFLNAVNYLARQENLIGIEPRTRELPRISFTNRQMKGTFFLAVFFLPLVLALVGTAVWWRQR